MAAHSSNTQLMPPWSLMEVGLISYIALPTQPVEYKNLGGNEAPQNMETSVIGHKKLNRRPHKRSQSQAEKALLQFSATGQAVGSPKLRKRGRKPNKQLKAQKVASQQEELDGDGLPKDPRRRRVIERNRIAAVKCRARKREEASALASREEAMEDQNRYLSTCVNSLNAEVYYLKTQLLRHTHCNCVLIHKYIAKEAKKCVGGLFGCSSAFDTHGSSLNPDCGSPNDANTADSLNMQGLEAGSFPPTLTNPFQQGSRASAVKDNMFDMGFEQVQTVTMPPGSMVSAQPVPTLSLTECGLGQGVNVGPQEHQADEIAWDLYWQFGC